MSTLYRIEYEFVHPEFNKDYFDRNGDPIMFAASVPDEDWIAASIESNNFHLIEVEYNRLTDRVLSGKLVRNVRKYAVDTKTKTQLQIIK